MPGYDELGNWMNYGMPVCLAALGHYTAGQAARMHRYTAASNPLMYAWGQYYYAAQAGADPPLEATPASPAADGCKVRCCCCCCCYCCCCCAIAASGFAAKHNARAQHHARLGRRYAHACRRHGCCRTARY